MIIENGYYRGDPIKVSERYIQSVSTVFIHSGYLFIDKLKVYSFSFMTSNSYYSLTKEIILSDGTLNDYEVNGDMLIVTSEKDEIHEINTKFRITSETEFEGRDRIFRYHSW
jgi:hypothetical protein